MRLIVLITTCIIAFTNASCSEQVQQSPSPKPEEQSKSVPMPDAAAFQILEGMSPEAVSAFLGKGVEVGSGLYLVQYRRTDGCYYHAWYDGPAGSRPAALQVLTFVRPDGSQIPLIPKTPP